MHYRKLILAIPAFFLACGWACAQPFGEDSEPSPEELDAAFSQADAAREAAAWSTIVIDRSRPDPIVAMTDSADLVFQGTVVEQQFVYNENGLPFTHTTFAVSEILKGSYPLLEITVIQEGGLSKDNPENIVMVSHAHYFSEGENELLFVDINPSLPAPREVSIEQRFRIFDGKVYDENGRGVLLNAKQEGSGYRLDLSSTRHPSPRFSQIQIGPHTLTKNFAEEDSGVPDSNGEQTQQSSVFLDYQNSINVAAFSAVIREFGSE